MTIGQRLFFFLVPGGLVTAAALLFWRWPAAAELRTFLPYYPPLVMAAGLYFGWRFNRSRLLLALLVLLLADRALVLRPGEVELARAVAVLLPLNLALIACYRERGLFTPAGSLRLALVALQPVALAALWSAGQERALAQLAVVLSVPLPLPDGAPFLSAAVAAALLLAGTVLTLLFLLRPGPLEGAFLWAVPVALAPLVAGWSGPAPTLGFATAGLILLAAVVETSHRLAFRDELTGLPARRALNEALLKVGRRFTVAMVDVDHFKKVNDRHGHDVGDQVLKMVAARLGRVSGGGRAFRYGGEEFAVLFPGKGVAQALPHLERLHAAIGEAGFTLRHRSRPQTPSARGPRRTGQRRLAVTVSIGVAERESASLRPVEVIKAADQALYRAKQAGRNRICAPASAAGRRPAQR